MRAKPASRGEREPFAVVADSHLDPFSPDHSDNMRAVFDHILARSERPAFVEHVGDVVEIGFPEEYAEWRRVRPDALVDLIRAVPDNHEVLEADSGDERWTADVGGFVGGRPAADERAVYAGAGDGKVHAFSLATGERLWERVLSSGAPYRTFILGPWATQPTLLPGDRVLVATVLNAYALDRSTGATAWELRGGFMDNAALLLADRLVMVDEFGGVVAVDPLTGAELWRTKLAQRVLGGSPALWKGAVAIGGVNGLVALLDRQPGRAAAGRGSRTVRVTPTRTAAR